MGWSLINVFSIVFCFISIFEDLTTRKVLNRTSLSGFFIISLIIILSQGFSNLGHSLLSSGVTLIIGYVLWRIRALGAGDVKVLSVLSLSLPLKHCPEFIFYSLVWGSLLGLTALLLNKAFLTELHWLNYNLKMTIRGQGVGESGHKIPFTVAILLGYLTLLELTSKGVHFL